MAVTSGKFYFNWILLYGIRNGIFYSCKQYTCFKCKWCCSSVNGIFPDLSGNVTVPLEQFTTGTLAARPPVGPQLVNGDIYVVSGDPTPSNKG